MYLCVTNQIIMTNSKVITQKQFAERLKLNYESNGSIYTTVNSLADFKTVQHTSTPCKPRLKTTTPTDAEIETYSTDLAMYNKNIENYKENEKLCTLESSNRTTAIEDFIKEEAGLNTIPEQYRSKVYSHAYDAGRSDGFDEVYQKLIDLVDIFN